MPPPIKKPSYLVEEDTQVDDTADLIAGKDTLPRSLLNKRVGEPQKPIQAFWNRGNLFADAGNRETIFLVLQVVS
jgi:hypothetical protein